MPTTQDLSFAPATPPVVVPVSGVAPWITAIAAGGLTVLDSESAGTVLQNPGAIVHSSRRLLVRPAYAGTTLRARMVYTADDEQSSILRIRVFGSTSAVETLWTPVLNLAGDASVEIPTAPASDPYEVFDPEGELPPTLQSTTPHPSNHVWDGAGFSHFLVGVERVYTALGGSTATNAYLEMRML